MRIDAGVGASSRSGPRALGAALVFAVTLLLPSAPASAQRPVVVWTAGSTASSGRAELWARRVVRGIEAEGLVVSESVDEWAMLGPGAAAGRVAEVAEVERAIEEAHVLAANLDEGRALVRLAAAERRAREALDVPGAVAWLVEVELELATLAHQLGEPALARACLARAASLSPERHLRTAEAPPDLVSVADAERSATRARPLCNVMVESSAPFTRVFVDDVDVGLAPARVERRAGPHAIRLEAPGHVPWAGLVDFAAGARPAIEIALAPEPAVALAHATRALARGLDFAALPGALAALAAAGRAPRALVLVVAGSGVHDRAIALSCDESGCRAPVRLEGTEAARLDRLEDELGGPSDVGSAVAWLDEALVAERPPPPPTEWWTEWWPWAGLGVVAAGALSAGLGVALTPSPPVGLVIRVTVEAP